MQLYTWATWQYATHVIQCQEPFNSTSVSARGVSWRVEA
jgi:hypothetical protein